MNPDSLCDRGYEDKEENEDDLTHFESNFEEEDNDVRERRTGSIYQSFGNNMFTEFIESNVNIIRKTKR